MSKTEETPTPKPEGTERRKAAVVVLIIVALAALLLCVGSFFGGTVPSATPDEEPVASASTSPEQGDDGEDGEPSAAADSCDHDWTVTYKTEHHDAVTHMETVEPEYEDETTYHTVCNDCKQVIDGKADEHIKETGHSGYSTNVPITDEVLVSEGYTKEVIDTPAYDETVPDALACTLCGETRPLGSTVE